MRVWTKTALVGLMGLTFLGTATGTIAQDLGSLSQAVQPAAIAITETEVRATLDQIIAASRRRDLEAIVKFLAPNVTIDLTIRTAAGSRKLVLTRQQYADYLKQGLTATEQYQAKYSVIKVRVAPDGKTATATYTVQESCRLKNQPISLASVSNETVTFQRVQGQLQATVMRAIAQVEIK